jgi:hypothetical protein
VEVPDELTWASQLQQRLASIPETRDIEVVNCGINAAVSLQEVERLEYEVRRNNIPDFCIFFDGINDVHQGIINVGPGATMRDAARAYNGSALFVILRRIARVSLAARTIYHSIRISQHSNDPAHTRVDAKVRELAKTTADVYERSLLRAKEICDHHGIRMMVFLQPHLFSIGMPWTSHDRAAAGRMPKSQGDALRVCYPLLREKLSRLRQQGVLAYDITDAFDGNVEPIFVDEYHVEGTGNRLIAEAILQHALPILKDSSPLRLAGPRARSAG